MHDFIGQRCGFILGELRLCGEWLLQHVVESMKRCEVTTVAGPDRFLDTMVARDLVRVRPSH